VKKVYETGFLKNVGHAVLYGAGSSYFPSGWSVPAENARVDLICLSPGVASAHFALINTDHPIYWVL
jgi:hypothetical protein